MARKSKKLAKRAPTPSQMLKRMTNAMRRFGGPVFGDDQDWSDPVKRGTVANQVLSFGSKTAGQSEYALDNYGVLLEKAFRAAGLNANNPHNWQLLLRVFAYIHFGPSATERQYTAIAAEFEKAIKTKARKNAVADVAMKFSVTTRTVQTAVAWRKQTFGR